MDQKNSDHPEGRHSTARRIVAWIAILLLAGMYIVTFIAALLSSPSASGLFRFCLGMTIAVPIAAWLLIYAIGWFSHRHTIASVDLLQSNPEARREMEEALQRQNPEGGAAGTRTDSAAADGESHRQKHHS